MELDGDVVGLIDVEVAELGGVGELGLGAVGSGDGVGVRADLSLRKVLSVELLAVHVEDGAALDLDHELEGGEGGGDSGEGVGVVGGDGLSILVVRGDSAWPGRGAVAAVLPVGGHWGGVEVVAPLLVTRLHQQIHVKVEVLVVHAVGDGASIKQHVVVEVDEVLAVVPAITNGVGQSEREGGHRGAGVVEEVLVGQHGVGGQQAGS